MTRGELIGQHVVVAARIAGLAEGGQILVSSLVEQIASPRGDLSFASPRGGPEGDEGDTCRVRARMAQLWCVRSS